MNITKTMNTSSKILFLIDHKHRDLPSAAMIGHYLQEEGYQVIYRALWDFEEAILSYDPKYIIVNKPTFNVPKLLEWKKEGRVIIVVQTEGTPQDNALKMNIQVPPDLIFFWNQAEFEKYQDFLTESGSSMEVLGCPRTDFFHEKLMRINGEREDVLRSYGLDPSRRTITYATGTPDAHFSEERIEQKRKIRLQAFKEAPDYLKIVDHRKRLLEFVTNLFRKAAEEYRDLNIIIKPHPNESVRYWESFVGSLPSDNVRICVGQTINHLLRASDFHVANIGCTTVFEGLVAGIPTAQVEMDDSYDLFQAEHCSFTPYRIRETRDIRMLIGAFGLLEGAPKRYHPDPNFKKYLKKYFLENDGQRCRNYSRSIDNFIKKREGASRHCVDFFDQNPHLKRLYYSTQIRRRVGAIKRKLLSSLRRKEGSLKSGTARQAVDELGRFDNRIQNGDELVWMDYFREAKI
jgi:surface carbohydrate biosynthesis protein